MEQTPIIPTQANLPYLRMLEFCKTFWMQDFPICKRAWPPAKLDGIFGRQGAWTSGADAASVAEVPLGFFPAAGHSEATQKAWLARLDAPTWGKAAAALASIASEAGILAALRQACEQGVDEVCDDPSREDEARQAWLAKLDAPTWDAVAAVVSEVAPGVGLAAGDNETAKVAWLAEMDASTWAAVAAAVSKVAFSEEALEEVAVASEIATEEEVKKARLARVHAPTLGKAAVELAKLDASAAWLADADATQAKADLAAMPPAAAPGDPATPLSTAPVMGNISFRSQYNPWFKDPLTTVTFKDGLRKRFRE